jgi:GTP-binding protein
VLAIVGRPNAGKSTLFNRLIRERKAIVDHRPGVTRDRNYGVAQWGDRKFVVIDTGGFDSGTDTQLAERVQDQSRRALSEADVVLFLFDGKEGFNPLDRDAVDLLRTVSKPVFFAVNKIDSTRRENNLYEFYALGLDRLFAISAEHGQGIGELFDEISASLTDSGIAEEAETAAPVRIAVIGRPNVGKSTLINRLLGFERSVVDSMPGTTRDALDTPFEIRSQQCILVDTAGIRRKARIDDKIEQFSVNRSLRSVDGGDLIIHVIDGPEGVTDQDAQILGYAFQRGKAILIAVNKWDIVSARGTSVDGYKEEVSRKLPFLDYVPVLFISAVTGHGLRKLVDAAAQLIRAYDRRIATSAFNDALQEIVKAHAAPLARGRPVKFFYGTQTGSRPPTFKLFVNIPNAVSETYERYLIRHLRDRLGLEHAPVKLILRARREERNSGRVKTAKHRLRKVSRRP